MFKIRQLQATKDGFSLNIPAKVAKAYLWCKGDYFQIEPNAVGELAVRKIGNAGMDKDQIELMALQEEAAQLEATLHGVGAIMGGGEFSFRLADYSRVMAEIRKRQQRIVHRKMREQVYAAEVAK